MLLTVIEEETWTDDLEVDIVKTLDCHDVILSLESPCNEDD